MSSTRIKTYSNGELQKSKSGFIGAVVLLAVAVLLGAIIVGICNFAGSYLHNETVTFTVTEKERIMDRDGSGSRYLIWSENETFENIDSLVKGKFNSSDLYGKLKVGETYTCEVYGWRNGFFSSYRNIVKCEGI